MPRAAWKNLEARAHDGYYKFFAWQKDPDNWWHEAKMTEGPGLDVLLPYWTLRYWTSHYEGRRTQTTQRPR